MSESEKPRRPKREIKLPDAYYSIHGEEGQKIAASPSKIDWRLPLIVIVFGGLVAAGVVFAIAEAEPADPWLDLTNVRVDSDEGYLYIMIESQATGSEPPWDEVGYLVGIDTYDAERGARTLPNHKGKIGSGIEFLLQIGGPDATELRVVEGYDPYDGEKPIVSPREFEGGFRSLQLTSNRERFARSGERIRPIQVDRGTFRWGSEDPAAENFDTRTDIAVGSGAIEMRIPWGLLNVSDPSSRRVLHSESHGREAVQSTLTNGFRIYVFSVDPASQGKKPADAIPSRGRIAPLYRWATWEAPNYEIEPKLGFETIRDTMNALPDHPETTDEDDDA